MGFSIYTTSLDPGFLDRLLQSPPRTSQPRSLGRREGEVWTTGDGICIEWAQSHDGRIRRILTRSGVRRRYVVPCYRGGFHEAHLEAEEESLVAILADACAGVQFQDHPARLHFSWQGEMRVHEPDFIVAAGSIAEFWECKKDREAQDFLVRHRTNCLRELLHPLGYGYRLVTTSDLKHAAYIKNAIQMRRGALAWHTCSGRDRLPIVKTQYARSAHEVLGAVPDEHRMNALLAVLYEGLLRTDLSQPVGLSSHVHPPPKPCGEVTPWLWELFAKSS